MLGSSRVTAIVLNWRKPWETISCVRALRAQEYHELRIVVVDNDPHDSHDLAAQLRELGVTILRNDRNLGFTGGVNVGLREAFASHSEYAWLVNSDALVPSDTLRKLVMTAESDPAIGLVSPIIHDGADQAKPLVCAACFDPVSLTTDETPSMETARAWLRDRADRLVAYGTALLIKRSLYGTIGGLDERFFAYVEDVDYSLRAHAAGFRVAICLEARIHHTFKDPMNTPAATPPYLYYLIYRNYPLLWRKHFPRARYARPALWLLRRSLFQIQRMGDRTDLVGALLAGLWDGMRNRGGDYDPRSAAPAWMRWTCRRFPQTLIALIDLPGAVRSPRGGVKSPSRQTQSSTGS